jgi:hypothetical protein
MAALASVGIRTYERPASGRTRECIVAQTHPRLEIIVSDTLRHPRSRRWSASSSVETAGSSSTRQPHDIRPRAGRRRRS